AVSAMPDEAGRPLADASRGAMAEAAEVAPLPPEAAHEETKTVKPDAEALAAAPAEDEISPVEETLTLVAAEVAPPIPPKKPADFTKPVEAKNAEPVKRAEPPAKKRATASASKARPAAAPSEAKQAARSP